MKGFTESVMTELAHEHSRVKLCMVQLPGLNTPQFKNRSKMPRHPMPVPPIWASMHRVALLSGAAGFTALAGAAWTLAWR